MMIVDFLLFITFLISSHSEVHYAVHSRLPVQHIHRLVKREGGIVRGSIPETNVYHVVLPQHAGRTTPVPSSSSGNPWIDSHEDEHSVRLHEHPEVAHV
ncbi:hypothetical protein EG68_04600 [Paragonimus skrjabini miyazakii]|uniref:Secreted protein n=1 Tax=Paragonimus skrjabini miyazakii TaxID=59628 RepID=A0A8S9Z5E1_9TREM|nr:hypothetical protein EG68_04600 [Paragonimus skrjabini miyazakii]